MLKLLWIFSKVSIWTIEICLFFPHDPTPNFHKAIKSHIWLKNVLVLFFRGGRCLLSECYWKHLQCRFSELVSGSQWGQCGDKWQPWTWRLPLWDRARRQPYDPSDTAPWCIQVKQECMFLEFICASQFPSLPSLFALASNLSNLCWPWVEGSGELSFLGKVALDAEPTRGTAWQIWQPTSTTSAVTATLTSEGFAKNSGSKKFSILHQIMKEIGWRKSWL